MEIRFYNTHNLVVPLLELLLVRLNNENVSSEAYISFWNYRKKDQKSNGDNYFAQSKLTFLSRFNKRINQIVYGVAAVIKVTFSKTRLNVFFTQPPLLVVVLSFISRVRGIKYGIHVMDLYPDLLGSLAYLNTEGFLYKFLNRKMTNALLNAEFVVVLGDCMKTYIKHKNVPNHKIVKLINIPSVSDVSISSLDSEIKSVLGLEGKFVILYSGNMGIAHEFETILKLSAELENTHPDIQFVFVGRGKRRREIENFMEAKNPSNIKLLPSLSEREFTSLLIDSDVHFISLKKQFLGLMVPSKFYSSVAVGKPVIFEGPDTCEIATQINKYKLGKTCMNNNLNELKGAFLEIYNDQVLQRQLGVNSKTFFEEHCETGSIIEHYCNYLKNQISAKN